jgi:hypothetical protein
MSRKKFRSMKSFRILDKTIKGLEFEMTIMNVPLILYPARPVPVEIPPQALEGFH